MNIKNRIHALIAAAAVSAAGLAAAPQAHAQPAAAPTPAVQGMHAALPDVIERAEAGVVVVLIMDASGEAQSQGSGFFIDARHVVTNRHVIDAGASAEVRLKSGRAFPVEGIVAEDRANDLVLLRVSIPSDAGHRALPLRADAPRKGDEILVLGAPRGLGFSVARGIVSALRPIEGMTSDRVIQIDAAISPGNSGGPVLNRAGEVVGVASFSETNGQSLNFAQGAWHVAALSPAGFQTLSQWNDARADEIFQRALNFYKESRYAESAQLLGRVVQTRPDHRIAWLMLGHTLDEIGLREEAILAFERHLRNGVTGEEAAFTLYNIGLISKEIGRRSQAIRALHEALEHDSNYTYALDLLGIMAWEDEDWEEVVKHYSRLLAIEPGDSAVRTDLSNAVNNIGVRELRAERLRTAARRFQEALEIDPENNLARLNLGIVASRLGYGGTARDMYEQLLARDPAIAAQLRQYLL